LGQFTPKTCSRFAVLIRVIPTSPPAMSFRSAKRVCYTRQNSTVFPTTDCNRAHEAKKERLYLKQEKEEIKQRVVRCSRARIRKKVRIIPFRSSNGVSKALSQSTIPTISPQNYGFQPAAQRSRGVLFTREMLVDQNILRPKVMRLGLECHGTSVGRWTSRPE